eukprot:GILJ01011561.1.p1 GENE.GILJ01011561.1~~GILJ01011561.1.p1  ORF type:complete len:404 (+),score=49.95 GILJ01011561.1:74-1285(+)
MDIKKLNKVLGENFEDLPLYKRINWLHVSVLFGIPLIALYGCFTTQLTLRTTLFSLIYYFLTGFGITVGYHRLFSHKSYEASLPVRFALIILGAGALQGSARWWCRDHRAHHRFTDTDKDPYSAHKGFLYSHIGWMLVKQDPSKIGRSDISDLNASALFRWQHKYYILIGPFMAFILPALVCSLWGDFWGGFFYAGYCRAFVLHHATFCVNSLAHWAGENTYADERTPKDSWITALVTLGEGYHNFHHEFPNDYRNAIRWYQYDPSKWIIQAMSAVGLVRNLHTFDKQEIKKASVQMKQKVLDRVKQELNWGPSVDSLKPISSAEFHASVSAGRQWVILQGLVLDLEAFIPSHPGGAKLLAADIGNDVTAKFTGEYYKHSNAARNIAATLRVGRIDDNPSSCA